MEKDLRIYENVAKDCEFVCALEGSIIFLKRNNALNEEIEKELEEIENRLTIIYQELPQQTVWEEYQKLINECKEINLKIKKTTGNSILGESKNIILRKLGIRSYKEISLENLFENVNNCRYCSEYIELYSNNRKKITLYYENSCLVEQILQYFRAKEIDEVFESSKNVIKEGFGNLYGKTYIKDSKALYDYIKRNKIAYVMIE